MTSHYEIITSWIDSCITELQLDNLYNKITNEWVLEQKLRDDLIDYWTDNSKRRAWVAAKVRNLDDNLYQDYIKSGGLANQLYSEPQPTDQCTH